MVTGAFELYNLNWFLSTGRTVFLPLPIIGCIFVLPAAGCACLKRGSQNSWREFIETTTAAVCIIWFFVGLLLGLIYFPRWSWEGADSQPGAWLSSPCHVLASGILSTYNEQSSTDHSDKCDPHDFKGYTALACDQFVEMRAHKKWVDAYFSCEIDSIPECSYMAWARVDVDGLGERCAYPIGYSDGRYTTPWPNMCQARSRLLDEMDQATYLGGDTVQCWVKGTDDRVVSFESDYPFRIKKTVFDTSSQSCASVGMVVMSAAYLRIRYCRGRAQADSDYHRLAGG